MNTVTTAVSGQTSHSSGPWPWLLLPSRLFFFLFFQALLAWWFHSWDTSIRYWLLSATLTNMFSIALLAVLFKREGIRYWRIFSFPRASLKKDLLLFAGLALLTVPVTLGPGYFLANLLWDDADIPTALMFGPIERGLAVVLLIAFPVTIAMAELATYFAYVMPRLQQRFKARWPALLLPVLFLSVQHCTLPFIPDVNFILYRALAFLPLALLIGVSLSLRPSLFVYFALLHGLLDFGTALMFLVDVR